MDSGVQGPLDLQHGCLKVQKQAHAQVCSSKVGMKRREVDWLQSLHRLQLDDDSPLYDEVEPVKTHLFVGVEDGHRNL